MKNKNPWRDVECLTEIPCSPNQYVDIMFRNQTVSRCMIAMNVQWFDVIKWRRHQVDLPKSQCETEISVEFFGTEFDVLVGYQYWESERGMAECPDTEREIDVESIDIVGLDVELDDFLKNDDVVDYIIKTMEEQHDEK